MSRFRFAATAALTLLVATTAAMAVRPLDKLQPPVAHDFNPAGDVVEVMLVAGEAVVDFGTGNQTAVWAYNGTIPGPTIDANIGDRLIVHFFNELPEETTIHWHGVDVPANMDGSNISQHAVPPGGYFRYEFDLMQSSLFWYHPHIRSREQVEKGLYGALLVHDPAADAALGLPTKETVLVLDDVLVDQTGQLAESWPEDPLEKAIMQVNGREGNVMLVNGRSGALAKVKAEPQRLRVVNVANARFMRISIPNTTMYRIGGDGGLLESPIEIPPIHMVPADDGQGDDDDGGHGDGGHLDGGHLDGGHGDLMSDPDPSTGIILTPGERADLIFTPSKGAPMKIEWHDFPRGRHSAFYKDDGSIGLGHAHDDGRRHPRTLLDLKVTGNPFAEEYLPPASLTTIDAIGTPGAVLIVSTMGHTPPNADGDITFFMQMKSGMPLPFPMVTPEDAPTLEVGRTYIWEVNNFTGGMHNFHTHGFGFQWIQTQFIDLDDPANNYAVTAPYLENKDTIILPARPGAFGRSRTITRLVMTIDDVGREGQVLASGKEPGEDTSGGWLFHCHLLEHANRGMMSFFQVVEP